MNIEKIFYLASILFFYSAAFAIGEKAEQLYDSGNCKEAISEYKTLLEQLPKTDTEIRGRAVFRIAYCQLTLEKYRDAEAGFRLYLKKFLQLLCWLQRKIALDQALSFPEMALSSQIFMS